MPCPSWYLPSFCSCSFAAPFLQNGCCYRIGRAAAGFLLAAVKNFPFEVTSSQAKKKAPCDRSKKFGENAIAICQDGVGEHDGCLGCRPAHPDTGPGGQHGGDVSHQSAPQRAEVRFIACASSQSVGLVALLEQMTCQAERPNAVRPNKAALLGKTGRTLTRPLFMYNDICSALLCSPPSWCNMQ